MNLLDANKMAHDSTLESERSKDTFDLELQPDIKVRVVAEELTVEKRTVETGRLHVHTTTHERRQTVDEPLIRKTVSVVVVPIQRMIDGQIPVARQEGDVYIVPVFEERLVVEKRLFLKEEVHIRTEQVTYHDPQSVVLRRTNVSVERSDASTAQTEVDEAL